MRRLSLSMLMLLAFAPRIAAAEDGMVEISVEITEINVSKANQLGVKWPESIQAGEVSLTVANRTPAALPEVPSLIKSGEWYRFTALAAELKLLQEKGAAKVLSKPKIVTRSGTSAKVIVGGELPIVASGVGGGTIQWKEYGIKTEITPRVLDEEIIDLSLATEVSRLDWVNQVQGNPSIMKREAVSKVRVRNGQTIALAGLIETKKEEAVSGLPLLSDIPVLGVLFSRKNLNETKTNVLIFVTPRIVE